MYIIHTYSTIWIWQGPDWSKRGYKRAKWVSKTREMAMFWYLMLLKPWSIPEWYITLNSNTGNVIFYLKDGLVRALRGPKEPKRGYKLAKWQLKTLKIAVFQYLMSLKSRKFIKWYITLKSNTSNVDNPYFL